MKIQSAKDLGQGPVKMLVYGSSGAGKTSLIKTLPCRTLVISAEQGLLSIAGNDIDYVDVSRDDDGKIVSRETRVHRMREVYQYMLTDEAREKYGALALDSGTEIAENVLEKNKLEHHGDKDAGFKIWGNFATEMTNMMKAFRDLPHHHVIITMLEELDKDQEGRMFYGPDIPGKAAKAFLLPAFDEVFRLTVGESGARKLQTTATSTVRAKDRSGKLAPFEEPNLAAIIAKIRGGQ